jgi:hypothetical protein
MDYVNKRLDIKLFVHGSTLCDRYTRVMGAEQ